MNLLYKAIAEQLFFSLLLSEKVGIKHHQPISYMAKTRSWVEMREVRSFFAIAFD